MKALDPEEKAAIKFRYAAALFKALKDSRLESYRQLAKQCGMESSHMQRISTGKLDVSVSTNVVIAQALGISYSKFSTYFDKLTSNDLNDFEQYLRSKKTRRGKRANTSNK